MAFAANHLVLAVGVIEQGGEWASGQEEQTAGVIVFDLDAMKTIRRTAARTDDGEAIVHEVRFQQRL